MDPEVNETMKDLATALCVLERTNGRGSTLIFVPEQPDEQVVVLRNGKPSDRTSPDELVLALADAHLHRPGSRAVNQLLLDVAERMRGRLVT